MSSFIMGVQAAQRQRKKLPKGKTQMFITPGWEEEIPPVEKREKRLPTDKQKKARRLQRA